MSEPHKPTPYLVSPETAVDTCLNALQCYGRGEITVWPRREQGSAEKGLFLFMPGRLGTYEGFKIIREAPSSQSGRLGTRTSWLTIRRPDTRQAWRMPADGITDMRTGAAGALAASFFVRKPITRAAIIGTGRVGRSLALCLDHLARTDNRLKDLKTIAFYSPNPDRRTLYRDIISAQLSLKLVETTSVDQAIEGASMVLLAAAAHLPVMQVKHLRPGLSISALSGSPFSAAISPDVLLAAGMVVVDDMTQCLQSGELHTVVQRGQLNQVPFARWDGRPLHLGDAAVGRLHLREDQSCIAYLSGLAILDLALGIAIIESEDAKRSRLWMVDTVSQKHGEEVENLWQPIP